jgi:hypothetical protein
LAGQLDHVKTYCQAQELAIELGFENFNPSTGWLDRFKKRKGITRKAISGESASVSTETTDAWKAKNIPELMQKYDLSQIYNADETGLFFRCLPAKTLACSGGKKSKKRLSVLLGANADGSDKLLVFVIGKSKNPRCFKNVKQLPVQ